MLSREIGRRRPHSLPGREPSALAPENLVEDERDVASFGSDGERPLVEATKFAQGVGLPNGIYDLRQHRGYIRLGTSHDTSEVVCDCLEDRWERFGRAAYPGAESLLLCDGGGNPADDDDGQAHLFRAEWAAWCDGPAR